jgi:PilZ domain-containing protein
MLPKPRVVYCPDNPDERNDMVLPLKSDQGHPVTTDDLETIALRPTVVGGARQDDDFEVIWRAFPVGRIMKQAASKHWWWACTVYGLPPTPNDRGPALSFKDCQVRFRLAWARIRPTLTVEIIQAATQHSEGLLEQQPAKAAAPSAPEPLQILDNHRVAPRHRVLKAGSIEFNGGAIDCTVRNVSDTGAQLEVASDLGIPDAFWLVIAGSQTPRHCRVAWRNDRRIGVAFD